MVRMLTKRTPQEPTQTATWRQDLLLDSYVQVYPRVSTPEQKKNVSAEMQQDKSFALMYGWIDEHIIMDTADLGLSGQLPMEERPAFVKMLGRIADGTIKAVIAAQVDRLFRDVYNYHRVSIKCLFIGVTLNGE
jgi:DNA invertase Pin-like site-specific DNA recombinase